MNDYAKLYTYSQQLLILGEVLEDETGQLFCQLLWSLSQTEPDASDIGRVYARLFRRLVEEAALYPGQVVGDAWQNHLLDRLLDTDNLIARKVRTRAMPASATRPLAKPQTVEELDKLLPAETLGLGSAPTSDLERLQKLYALDGPALTVRVRDLTSNPDLPAWRGFTGLTNQGAPSPPRTNFKQLLDSTADWAGLLGLLMRYYRSYDNSDFSRHSAFRWVRHSEPGQRGGYFEPVRYLDDQRFENLVGYERERAAVIANTAQFVAGLSANHVLLYGARGTGKSSTVKALLPHFVAQGLRLVEVHKSELGDYQLIAAALRERSEKFILFVDDLSFEAEEVYYKDLKALLEGSLEARPANLLIYATSNRRHLIKEQFSDNARMGDDEVNAWDTVEEKLSLSDRFGLIITFISPNQKQYLEIVDGLARQAGIEMTAEELHRRALRWELSHSGLSGRTARQFIDQLSGEIDLKSKI